MKSILFILVSFCLLQNIQAQVTGAVINTNGKPVPAANVMLLKSSDSSLIRIGLTNDNGNFIIENISDGRYILNVTAVGYKTIFSLPFELTATQPKKNFDTLALATSLKELQEVIVRQEKPLLQQKPEGIVVNVENSILTKGSSALQLLERSPGIVINRRDNSIELNGKSGVMVMLNGKLIHMSESELLDLLDGMSGDDISTIELLTSPSAKYDAEGAGLINIALKKNKRKGTSGSVNASAGYGYREKATAGFNLSHNTSKINLYSSYNFSHNRSYSDMFVDSWQNMPFLGGNIHALGWDTTHVLHDNHNATLGIDIKANAQTTIGGGVVYSNNRSSGTTYTHIGYNVLPDSLLQYNGWNSGMSQWNNLISSVYAERTMKNSGKLDMDFDYLYFHHNGPYNVEGTFVNKHGEEAGNDRSLSAQAQKGFAKTIINVSVGKRMQLEAGVKAAFTESGSYSGFESLINGDWTGDPQAVNDITMKEAIGAAYGSINTRINPTTSLVTGVRYEYASTNMNDTKTGKQIVHRRLSSFFPNIFFSKKINERSEIQLSYTKRITRPSYNDLASYVGYGDPTAVYTGNPFLQPTITHNIKLGYNYKNYAFSLLFSRDENAIARYQLTESPNHDMLIISPRNIRWQNNLTFQTTLPLKVNDWWTMNYSFVGGLRQYRVEYTKQPFQYAYFGYSFNCSQAFKIPHHFSAEISANCNNTDYNGTQKDEGIFRLNIGIKKELENNKGSFQFSITDILRNELYNIHYGKLTQEAFHINSQVIVYTETSRVPVFRLTYSRSFGNNKTKRLQSNISTDEQERIRKE
jgi:iron complex outermembrane recepter protein